MTNRGYSAIDDISFNMTNRGYSDIAAVSSTCHTEDIQLLRLFPST